MITFYREEYPQDRDAVINVIHAFEKFYEGRYNAFADGTFGHIVLGDYNLGDDSLDFCLKHETIQDWYAHAHSKLAPIDKWTLRELDARRDEVILFLRWLLEIDEAVREGEDDEE